MFNLDYFKSEYMRATDSVSVSVGLDCAEYSDIFLNNEYFQIFLRYFGAPN